MTADVQTALTTAERFLAGQDGKRTWWAHRDKVAKLTQVGWTSQEIALDMGLSTRHVQRLRKAPPAPVYPQPPNPAEISEERAAEMEALAGIALVLSGRLRDENPCLVWEVLSRLSRRRLQELCVILLASVPQESTFTELFGWVA